MQEKVVKSMLVRCKNARSGRERISWVRLRQCGITTSLKAAVDHLTLTASQGYQTATFTGLPVFATK